MQLVDVHSLPKPIDIKNLINTVVIMMPVFTVFMFSSQSVIFNCSITELGQKIYCVSSLSEYYYRADNKEHEFKERIDRKRSLVYPILF